MSTELFGAFIGRFEFYYPYSQILRISKPPLDPYKVTTAVCSDFKYCCDEKTNQYVWMFRTAKDMSMFNYMRNTPSLRSKLLRAPQAAILSDVIA